MLLKGSTTNCCGFFVFKAQDVVLSSKQDSKNLTLKSLLSILQTESKLTNFICSKTAGIIGDRKQNEGNVKNS